eukprot:gb/GFBE01030897.1/.p1 GENE.gb/GFBE01030897.1/~~gb/GFBE01030897.1/.p1  ORF type:complete len:387 (+),score=93.36 gb/GFBE01030897.1/:1-1161(+)
MLASLRSGGRRVQEVVTSLATGSAAPTTAGRQVEVAVLPLSGESFEASTLENATIFSLKEQISMQLELNPGDFQLVASGCERMLQDSELVSSLTVEREGELPSVCIIRHTTLERDEQKALAAWCDVAEGLQNTAEIKDEVMLDKLCQFLDMYPALVNWQTSCELKPSDKVCKPLLSFAVDAAAAVEARQLCVEELLKRGARVDIRHVQSSLLERARETGSAYCAYLETMASERRAHEMEALSAWRNVSSKLCGECMTPVDDEAEMTKIVSDFCTKYPEMVNFQNNHAVGADGAPYGYFGYATLLSFAGAHMCRRRRRRGQEPDKDSARQGAVFALLQHGARVDVHHAGKTSMEWMREEGSLLMEWLERQLQAPAPAREAFEFAGRQ